MRRSRVRWDAGTPTEFTDDRTEPLLLLRKLVLLIRETSAFQTGVGSELGTYLYGALAQSRVDYFTIVTVCLNYGLAVS